MRDRSDVIRGIERMETDVRAFFAGLNPDVFFRKPPTGWSPAQNLNHFIKSLRPVRLSLRLPRATFLMFGTVAASGTPQDVIDRYLTVLASGFQAGLAFRPGGSDTTGSAESRAQNQMIDRYGGDCATLAGVVEKWSEGDLDRYRMPHPATGLLTVREMLYFTVFHPYHHMGKVRARLAGAG